MPNSLDARLEGRFEEDNAIEILILQHVNRSARLFLEVRIVS